MISKNREIGTTSMPVSLFFYMFSNWYKNIKLVLQNQLIGGILCLQSGSQKEPQKEMKMEKDMEYYIQVSGRIMKDNLDKRKSLPKRYATGIWIRTKKIYV